MGVNMWVYVMTAAEVVALRPREYVQQDAEPIATIYRNLGTSAAERVVSRALTELAATMSVLARLARANDLGDLERQLRRLQQMAENLGLVSLGKVAGDARVCLAQGDSTAFTAVWSRLVRVAESSLATDKDLLDQSLI